MIENGLGEITLKILADEEQDVDNIVDTLKTDYKLVSRGRVIQNDRRSGVHCFVILEPLEEDS